MITRVMFNTDLPAIAQNDDWSCSLTALRWALTALGRNPTETWIEDTALQAGVVTRQFGLMDSSGARLAAFVREHWGEFGYDANHDGLISFRDAALEGGHAYPILIGGRAWNHWCAVRGYDEASDRLLLANPANGHMGVEQRCPRRSSARWDRSAWFGCSTRTWFQHRDHCPYRRQRESLGQSAGALTSPAS